jgi:hypothetical protein
MYKYGTTMNNSNYDGSCTLHYISLIHPRHRTLDMKHVKECNSSIEYMYIDYIEYIRYVTSIS